MSILNWNPVCIAAPTEWRAIEQHNGATVSQRCAPFFFGATLVRSAGPQAPRLAGATEQKARGRIQ
jgi:hypothetical protein